MENTVPEFFNTQKTEIFILLTIYNYDLQRWT